MSVSSTPCKPAVARVTNQGRHFSSATTAVCLFGIFNLLVVPVVKAKPDSNGMTYALSNFSRCQPKPDIVFLGSSVAKHVYESIPLSDVREKHLSSLAFNLQLISDGFILTNKVMKSPALPRILVICVSPRDFRDNDLRDPTRSTTFRRLVSLSDMPFYASVLNLDPFDRLRVAYNEICSLYDVRAAIQKRFSSEMATIYDRLGVPGASTGVPEQPWKRSLREYAWLYEGIDVEKIATQVSILKRSVDLCKRRSVKVVLVNLPMSKDNLDLLPSGFYDRFRDELSGIADGVNCQFVDCASSTLFTSADFVDTAHLNKGGGLKVFAMLQPFFDEQSKKNISFVH